MTDYSVASVYMKTFKELALDIVTKVDEDAPANAVSTGQMCVTPNART